MTPKIRATTSSVPTFDQPLPAGRVIPGTAAVAAPRAAAETTTRSRNLIVQILLDCACPGGRPPEPPALSPGGTHPPGPPLGGAPRPPVPPGPPGPRKRRRYALGGGPRPGRERWRRGVALPKPARAAVAAT